MTNKLLTIKDISPLTIHDPVKYLSKDWSGTIVDILIHDNLPYKDKLTIVCSYLRDMYDDSVKLAWKGWTQGQPLEKDREMFKNEVANLDNKKKRQIRLLIDLVEGE